MIESYRDLVVWQKAMDLAVIVYKLLFQLPNDERFALKDQMRRAAVSIPSNIAEGYARKSPKDYARFISIARGSVYELQTQLMLCERLGYMTEQRIENAMQLSDEVARILYGILARI